MTNRTVRLRWTHTLSAWRRQSIRLILPFWSGLDSTHMAGFLPVMLSTKSSLHSCVMSFLSLPNSLDAHFCFTSTFSFWNRDSTFLVPFPPPSAQIPSFAVDLPKIRCIQISTENLPWWNFVQLLTSLWALGCTYSGKTFARIRPTSPDKVHGVSWGYIARIRTTVIQVWSWILLWCNVFQKTAC